MPTPSPVSNAPGAPLAFAAALDCASIITEVANVKQARALPSGSVVGDLHGGLTFSDAVAAALESRSQTGWREVHSPEGEMWTIIAIDL